MNRDIADELDSLERDARAIHPAYTAEFDRRTSAMRSIMVAAGLDPADPKHRRAYAMGLCVGCTWTPENAQLNAAAALRPPVIQ